MSVSTVTKSEILSAVAEGTMTPEEASRCLSAMVEPQPLRLKVSPKGGVSVYGLGRFPTMLYAEQWRRVLEFGNEVTAFIQAHEDQLTFKNRIQSHECGIAPHKGTEALG